MAGQIIALHPVEFEVSTEDCIAALSSAMMEPVFALAALMEAKFQSDGLPRWRKVRVTVHASEALTAALRAEGAFDLIVEYDQ
jgi:hypothetical protein